MSSTIVDVVSSKIEKEGDIEKIGSCVFRIVDRQIGEVARKIANHVNIRTLSSKIEKEEDIRKIGSCVGHIAFASKEVALKLVDVVSSKIEKEEDVEKIGLYMSDIVSGNKKVAQEIVNRLNPKLRKELKKGGWLK